MSNPSHLLMLDLETTDSDPRSPIAAILEIGAILVEWAPDLPVVGEADLIVRPPGLGGDHDAIWAQMHPVVRDMHRDNGLWDAATTDPDAWSLADADAAMAQWVVNNGAQGQVPVIGSGVSHLDIPFIKTFMPQLATRLTYWSIDIGNVRRMLDLAGQSRDYVDLATDVEAKPHRALEDARLHLVEARRYLAALGQLPRTAEAPA